MSGGLRELIRRKWTRCAIAAPPVAIRCPQPPSTSAHPLVTPTASRAATVPVFGARSGHAQGPAKVWCIHFTSRERQDQAMGFNTAIQWARGQSRSTPASQVGIPQAPRSICRPACTLRSRLCTPHPPPPRPRPPRAKRGPNRRVPLARSPVRASAELPLSAPPPSAARRKRARTRKSSSGAARPFGPTATRARKQLYEI